MERRLIGRILGAVGIGLVAVALIAIFGGRPVGGGRALTEDLRALLGDAAGLVLVAGLAIVYVSSRFLHKPPSS